MRLAAAVAVEYFFAAGVKEPVVIISEKLAGAPRVSFFFISCAVRRAVYKRFSDKYVHGVYAGLRRVGFQAAAEILALRPRQEVENAAAENNVVFRVGAVIENIRLKQFYFDLVVLRKSFCFFDSLL